MQGTKTDRLRMQGIRSKGQDVGNIFQKLKQVQFPLSNTVDTVDVSQPG